MRQLPLLLAALIASGCAKPLEVGSITEIKSSTGSKSVDVHEPRRAAGQPGTPAFAGDQIVEVRTYSYVEGQGDVEFAGASCTLSAAEFTATMQSPAKVRVPLYRGQSSTLPVGCETPGFQRKMITVSPFDVTRQERMSGGASRGLLGLVVVTAIDAMSDNSQNEWRYPPASLVMERLPAKTASASY
jgi:hypothetical protein